MSVKSIMNSPLGSSPKGEFYNTLHSQIAIGKKPSHFDCLYLLMENKIECLISKAIDEITTISKCSKDSVSGSTFQQHHFGKLEKWKTDFILVEKNNDRYVKWKMYQTPLDKVADWVNYDTKEKHNARKFVLEILSTITEHIPMILVLGNKKGHDIKLAYEYNSSTIIHNVEFDEDILSECKKQQLPDGVVHNLINISDYIKRKYFFDIIYYDCGEYVCPTLAEDMKNINEKRMSQYLFITLKDFKGIRNKGDFFYRMKEEYKDCHNKSLFVLFDILTNYQYCRSFRYKSGGNTSTKKKSGMIIYKFKLV